jgi:hypothetical protein
VAFRHEREDGDVWHIAAMEVVAGSGSWSHMLRS